MTKRNEALLSGQLTYFSGKPCRRGHQSERYVSGGMCIQCVKDKNDERVQAQKDARRQHNTLRTEGARIYQKLMLPSGAPLMDKLAHIINSRDVELIEQCDAFLTLMRQQVK